MRFFFVSTVINVVLLYYPKFSGDYAWGVGKTLSLQTQNNFGMNGDHFHHVPSTTVKAIRQNQSTRTRPEKGWDYLSSGEDKARGTNE
jgi:hypothetical protein